MPVLARPTGVLLRPGVRRVLGGLAVALTAFGAGMLVYPVATNLYNGRQQARLRREFSVRLTQGSTAASSAVHSPLGIAIIQIPRLGLDSVVVEGTDPADLRAGPGHYPGSPQPCSRGNVAIAGHRTTYGKPFEGLDQLVAGDGIVLVTPSRRCTYQVVPSPPGKPTPHRGSAAWISAPTDWSPVAGLQGSFLTLTTCHPKTSAAQRLILRARLVPEAR